MQQMLDFQAAGGTNRGGLPTDGNVWGKPAGDPRSEEHTSELQSPLIISYAVGFNDPKYFSSCFKKEFGMLPTEYQERFIQS